MPELRTWRYYRARVGALSRDRAPNDPDLIDARRNLAASVLEERVRHALSSDPPLSAEQRSRIAGLLWSSTRHNGSSRAVA